MGLGLFSVFAWVGQAQAVSFTGDSGSSLSPRFGTLVNFDDKPTGTLISPDDYVSVGVTSITETEGLGMFARYSSSQSQPNYIGTGYGGERGDDDDDIGWDGTILIELTQLTNKVSIDMTSSVGEPEILSIYDSTFSLLETATAPDGTNTYAGFTRDNFDIKYFSIKGDYFAVDDLQFTSVPEPTSVLSILALGAFGAGLLLKRKQKQKAIATQAN